MARRAAAKSGKMQGEKPQKDQACAQGAGGWWPLLQIGPPGRPDIRPPSSPDVWPAGRLFV